MVRTPRERKKGHDHHHHHIFLAFILAKTERDRQTDRETEREGEREKQQPTQFWHFLFVGQVREIETKQTDSRSCGWTHVWNIYIH